MEKLNAVGWQTEGVEWNEDAAQLARETTGSNVWAGDFRLADVPKGKYGLIVLNHVFEHINDPKQALARVHELLADGGRAVLFYPNPHSLGAEWNRADWFPWEVPRHLIFPSVNAIKLVARNAGFAEASAITRAYYSEVHWSWSKAYEMNLNPAEHSPRLGIKERFGVLLENLVTRSGFEKGWEIVATLRK